MEATIQEVTRITGVTSRTLRHYDAIGLLAPSGTGPGGIRRYDDAALGRLQRILALRDLGLPLAEVRAVLAAKTDEAAALADLLARLGAERDRLDRQIAAVAATLTARTEGRTMTEEMFDGFDHTVHREEVEERWGKAAYADSDRWWRSMSPGDRAGWQSDVATLNADWTAAAAVGTDPTSPAAQDLAARHVAWLAGIPGTPGHGGEPDPGYLLELAEMYVADERFAANYGGVEGATFVRDALRAWVAAR